MKSPKTSSTIKSLLRINWLGLLFCLLVFTYVIALPACNKDEDMQEENNPCPPIEQSEMWNCHLDSTWTIQKISDGLIGEWQWKYSACFWTPQDALCDSIPNYTVTFDPDHSVTVKRDGAVSATSTWEVKKISDNQHILELTSPVYTLYGIILFCEDIVAFNDSESDGCDNFFKRIE